MFVVVTGGGTGVTGATGTTDATDATIGAGTGAGTGAGGALNRCTKLCEEELEADDVDKLDEAEPDEVDENEGGWRLLKVPKFNSLGGLRGRLLPALFLI